MRVVIKCLRLKSRSFRYKVALYVSYLHTKLDYEIKGNKNIHVILYLQCFNCMAINKKLAGLSKVTEK